MENKSKNLTISEYESASWRDVWHRAAPIALCSVAVSIALVVPSLVLGKVPDGGKNESVGIASGDVISWQIALIAAIATVVIAFLVANRQGAKDPADDEAVARQVNQVTNERFVLGIGQLLAFVSGSLSGYVILSRLAETPLHFGDQEWAFVSIVSSFLSVVAICLASVPEVVYSPAVQERRRDQLHEKALARLDLISRSTCGTPLLECEKDNPDHFLRRVMASLSQIQRGRRYQLWLVYLFIVSFFLTLPIVVWFANPTPNAWKAAWVYAFFAVVIQGGVIYDWRENGPHSFETPPSLQKHLRPN